MKILFKITKEGDEFMLWMKLPGDRDFSFVEGIKPGDTFPRIFSAVEPLLEDQDIVIEIRQESKVNPLAKYLKKGGV